MRQLLTRLSLSLLLPIGLLWLLVQVFPSQAEQISTRRYLAPTGLDSGDCTEAANPCQTLGYALTQVNAGAAPDVLSLADGVYAETVVITKPIVIVGNDSCRSCVILKAPFRKRAVVLEAGLNSVVRLEDLTVEGSGLSGPDGGLIFGEFEHLVLRRVDLKNGSSGNRGGGVFLFESILKATDVTFSANIAREGGGGAYLQQSEVSLTNVSFISNTAGGSGGGLMGFNSNMSFLTGTLESNVAINSGGGLYLWAGSRSVTLTNVTISANSAERGGGLAAGRGQLTLMQVTLAENQAVDSGGQFGCIGCGGGLYIDDGQVTVALGSVRKNTALKAGGGIYNGDVLTVTQTSLLLNTADEGGGIYSRGGSRLSLTSDNVEGNSARRGGGVYSNGATAVATTIVTDNAAVAGGGFFLGGNAALSMTTTSVSANTALPAGGMGPFEDGYGGGLWIGSSLHHISQSTISQNEAETGGGIYNSGWVTITHSLFSTNTANDQGGGVYNQRHVQMANSTLSGNLAVGDYGGGFFNDNVDDIPSLLTHVTIANNQSDRYGAGLANYGEIEVRHAVLAGNQTNLQNAGLNCFNSSGGLFLAVDANLADDTSCRRFTLLDQDAKLGPLANNGGQTATHALLTGSPAIDAGSGPCLPNDQRGYTRDASCDLGGFEYAASPPPPPPVAYLVFIPLILQP